jgi:hypothetical protein
MVCFHFFGESLFDASVHGLQSSRALFVPVTIVQLLCLLISYYGGNSSRVVTREVTTEVDVGRFCKQRTSAVDRQ